MSGPMTSVWAFALLVAGAPWPGGGNPGPAAQCDPTRLAEVDFLRGEWLVESVEPGTPPRERSGVATVSPVAGGCALQEHLRLDDGYEAVRILAFDERSEAWQLALVDGGHGNIVFLTGHPVEDGLEFITTHQRRTALLVDRLSMIRTEDGWTLRAETAAGYGEPWRLLQEITYTPNPTLRRPDDRGEPMVVYGYAITDARDSVFIRLELEAPPGRPAARLAMFGEAPLPFDSVSIAPDTSTVRWLWPGRVHDRCRLARRAGYHWEGVCRSEAGERRLELGGGYTPDLGQDLEASRTDVRILDRAATLLRTEADWNRDDDRVCDDDDRAGRRSLFCALYRASIEVTGAYLHRRPAMSAPREVIHERAGDRVVAHTLRDFNNHETTTFGEIREVIEVARDRLSRAIGDTGAVRLRARPFVRSPVWRKAEVRPTMAAPTAAW